MNNSNRRSQTGEVYAARFRRNFNSLYRALKKSQLLEVVIKTRRTGQIVAVMLSAKSYNDQIASLKTQNVKDGDSSP